MNRTYDSREGGPVSEMAIVDTFTKLIFGEESDYSERELMIIQALRSIDQNVTLDSHRDMGVYLRALGVQEMVKMVGSVREAMLDGLPLMRGPSGGPAGLRPRR